jgi:large subunit ribosomal protein L11
MSPKSRSQITAVIKMILKAGKATPAYPVGPTLGGYGVNIGLFVREYNEQTAHLLGMKVPVEVTIMADRSFSMRVLQPTAASLLKRAAGLDKGAAMAGRGLAGTITRAQLREIAERKLGELNTDDVDAAMQIIAGTARSMGIEVAGEKVLEAA